MLIMILLYQQLAEQVGENNITLLSLLLLNLDSSVSRFKFLFDSSRFPEINAGCIVLSNLR